MTKEARIYNGEKTVSSISGAGKLDSYMQKNEIRTLPDTIYKKKERKKERKKTLKMD